MGFCKKKSTDIGTPCPWIHWLATFIAVALAGVFLLPFLCSQPESIHTFLGDLASWQRIAFIFGLCVVIAALLFKLFTPRVSHLRYLPTHPPIWAAWALATVILCAVDLTIGLSRGQYTASICEWFGYAGGSVALVLLYVRFTAPNGNVSDEKKEAPDTVASVMPTDWPSLEAWLDTDEPAKHDFLRNYAVAERLEGLLVGTTRSIGIVGAFGAGKSTIVKWIRKMADASQPQNPPPLLFSEHSCWGFESSASAIHSILSDGIEKVSPFIDTFPVKSLPESYRRVFSAGGEWLDKLSSLVFRRRDPIQQFQALSDLLRAMGSRLVFVVEDLDRNNSQTFDIQDVLAFLQQLKDFRNLSFVLTGGLKSPARIDFAKLCDHIEYLKTVDVQDSARLVCCLRERCLDGTVFPHEVLTPADNNQWAYESWMTAISPDEVHPPEAVARLLNTPRSLRHALARTYHAWQRLVGEIDWDHLLAVNVLRYAAPEALSFVVTYWDRLNDQPPNEDYKKREVEAVRSTLKQDWEKIISGVDWDVRAARALIDLILLESPAWFDDKRQGESPRLQGVHQERYWQRVLNEVLGPGEVLDQAVARDFREWCNTPSEDTELVRNLCLSSEYSDVWEPLACQFWELAPRDWVAPTQPTIERARQVLLLSEQVMSRICREHGSAASGQSQGLHSVLHVSNKCVPYTEGNREWLKDRIREAMSTSLALANILFRWWAAADRSIVRSEEKSQVRESILEVAKDKRSDSQNLRKIIDPKHSCELQTLVFRPSGDDHPTTTCTDIDSWKWLGPVLLDALKQGDEAIAVQIYWLVASLKADTRKDNQYRVDSAAWHGFFGERTAEIVQLLEETIGRLEGDDQNRVRLMVDSVKRVQSPPPSESQEE